MFDFVNEISGILGTVLVIFIEYIIRHLFELKRILKILKYKNAFQ